MKAIAKRAALLALLSLVHSCGRPPTAEDHGEHDGHEHASQDATAEGHGQDHDHGAEESDLDRPVEELFAAGCEHGVKTHQCEECRYEVGVARAPGRLFEEGLLHLGHVEARAVETTLTLTGEIVFDAQRVADLGTTAPGVVRQVRVALGERVRRGQVLLELESAEAGEAEEALLEAAAQLKIAERGVARIDELRREGISSEREHVLAAKDLEASRNRVATARQRLAMMGQDTTGERLPSAEEPRGRLVVKAAGDGAIIALHAAPGESVQPGDVLVTLADNSSLWVWCDLHERDLAALHGLVPGAGWRAVVTVKAWPGEEFTGVVDLVSPVMDAATRTVKVRVAVRNPAGRLLAGMFARVGILLPGGEMVAAVPRAAVCEDEGRAFIFVPHHEDYFVRRPITTGRAWGDWVELLQAPDGVSTVVTEGVFLLKSDVLRSKMGAGCAD
ncbi:MAG: efflux RND transporter periplasmic adaptor subunit [bacterium]|jgi:cobalt-zinc-cadmium efflux system membrane fusion protein|nr:efflux RND transporter periplasmic adaptor subunit [bacterium]